MEDEIVLQSTFGDVTISKGKTVTIKIPFSKNGSYDLKIREEKVIFQDSSSISTKSIALTEMGEMVLLKKEGKLLILR